MKFKKVILMLSGIFALSAFLYGCTSEDTSTVSTTVNSEPHIIKYEPPQGNGSSTNSNSSNNKASNAQTSTSNVQPAGGNTSSKSEVTSVTSSKSSNISEKNASKVDASSQTALYESIKKGIESGNDISIDITKSSVKDNLADFALKVASQTGYAGYLSNVEYNTVGNNVVLHFNYKGGKDTFFAQINAVNSKVQAIVNSVVKSGMSDFQKELALHDYVVNNTVYDYKNLEQNTLPDDSFTAYGVLLKNVAVCEGYSEAMYRLLNAAGVNTKIITGTANGVGHAWNLVNINGAYYHLDATFDDPVSQSGNILSYNYFNVTDSQISKDHSWTSSDYPSCTSTAENYFKVNNLYASNQNEFNNIIYDGLAKKKTTIICKTISYDTNTFSPNALVNIISKHPELSYVNSSKGFSYSYDQNSSVMEFFVSYK